MKAGDAVKTLGLMCNTTYRVAPPTAVFVMRHSSQTESHGLRGAAACTAVQQPHTHSGKDMNVAYARQSEHFKVSAQDVQMFSLAISSEAKL